MVNISVLDKSVWTKIAAGEVVEKPASIIKELVENSIDAGARNITIEIKNGGISYISVLDDGCGIQKDQVGLAFVAHATSKIKSIDDLYNLSSMGFRGEALASISAVSFVEMITKTQEQEFGYKIELEGGEKKSFGEIACVTGTQIKVKNLFFNTPARAKFLRKPKTEENDITNYVEKLMLSHSDINFKYIVDDKMIYNTTNCSIIDVIYTIYGKEIANNMIEVNYFRGNYNVYGYISKPNICKSNRTYQSLFVNKRFCINQLISASVSNAYESFLMKGKFPVYVLFLSMPKNSLDVNVHPNKLEVKFENSQLIYSIFNDAIYQALANQTHIVEGVDNDVKQNKIAENVENHNFNMITNSEGISFDNKKIDNEFVSSEHFVDKVFLKSEPIVFKQNLYESKIPEVIVNVPKESNDISYKNFEVVQDDKKIYDGLFSPTRIVIGVVFNTYIIVQEEDRIYFIDQHAAHERQLFDALIKQVEDNNIPKQNLLIPYILNVNDIEFEFLTNNIEILKGYGFDIEEFGKNCYKITSIPMLLYNINLKEYFDEILSNLSGNIKKPHDVLRNDFATMACKAAVKAGNKLSQLEINTLLDKLKENNNTLLCPHGRPIVVTFDKKQIEKMFKRIV